MGWLPGMMRARVNFRVAGVPRLQCCQPPPSSFVFRICNTNLHRKLSSFLCSGFCFGLKNDFVTGPCLRPSPKLNALLFHSPCEAFCDGPSVFQGVGVSLSSVSVGSSLLGLYQERGIAAEVVNSRRCCRQVRCMSGKKKSSEQPRGSLWRTRSVISKEVVVAVHDLKRAKDDPQELNKIFQTRVSRLLKMDLLATLSELQRQKEIALALRVLSCCEMILKVFDIVRKEIWYTPDVFLYRSMMDALGKNRMVEEVEKKFQELQDEGIKPDLVIYRELVGAYVRVNMLSKALEVHEKMKELGCGDDELTNNIITHAQVKINRAVARAEATNLAGAASREAAQGSGEDQNSDLIAI